MSQSIFPVLDAVKLALLSADTKSQSKDAANEFMKINAAKSDDWYDMGIKAQQVIAEDLQTFLSFEKLEQYPELNAYLSLLECLKIVSYGF